jgi:hypothetical protein
MSDDSEPEIDPDAILAAIEDEESCDGSRRPSVDELVDALTTAAGGRDAILASNAEGGCAADSVLDGLTDRKSEFSKEMKKWDARYAPYVEQMATWMEYAAAADNIDERWPFALAEDEEVNNNE